MKKVYVFVCSAFVCCSAFATLQCSVTNVVAKQRYPWNGLVDVSYEIVGSTNGLGNVLCHLTAVDQKTQTSYAARTFVKPIDLTEGSHVATWNMCADHNVVSETMIFRMLVQTEPLYRVIDVSEGSEASSYPVLEMDAIPDEGWSDEYKTDKIVLRCIDGTNGVYYAGIFEITQAQWDKVMGGTSTSTNPKDGVTYNSIRGDASTYDWPTSTEVDPTSFIGKLRQKTGLMTLDLPSVEEWKFAARAGVTTKYLCGDSETGLSDYDWYKSNSGGLLHPVGELKPNAWGLYDVQGNVCEWCLDLYTPGWGDHRRQCGGYYDVEAAYCVLDRGWCNHPGETRSAVGFRLFCRPGTK